MDIFLWASNLQMLFERLEKMTIIDACGKEYAPDEAFSLWTQETLLVSERSGTIYLAGNGASASMASHFTADLTKNGRVRAQNFTDLSLITALGNDMGFEHVFSFPLHLYAQETDMLVVISSSGNSPNIVSAVETAIEKSLFVVTLSSFTKSNKIHNRGSLNFHIPSENYGIAESCHTIILHHWMDKVSAQITSVFTKATK